MGDNNQSMNKGVFPGADSLTEGSIQTGQPVPQETQKTKPVIVTPNTGAPVAAAPAPEQVEQVEQGAPAPAPQETNTYMNLETKNSEGGVTGIMEIDLISFRERGEESRYLAINATGAGTDGNQSETIISIRNEEEFNRLKAFISQLNWND